MHPRRGRSVSATLLIKVLGSFLALGVALALPALRTHHFGELYRPIEVRQAAARHSVLDFEDSSTDVQLEQITIDPLREHRPVEDSAQAAATNAISVLAPASPPLALMLRRFRLGGSRSSPPDPLIA
jgi:hypothetical protein